MAREIKFRAWHEGYSGRINVPAKMLFDEKPGDCLIWSRNQPVHLMQFTGLKDKNGKEIYEGDVLKDAQGEVSGLELGFNCMCCDGVYGWRCERSIVGGDGLRRTSELEIIGNIYENPDLLEKK